MTASTEAFHHSAPRPIQPTVSVPSRSSPCRGTVRSASSCAGTSRRVAAFFTAFTSAVRECTARVTS
ncbi:hypothetical protein [Streptomyces goshikiensis]|uniref:hypothetical protein n=1 Tax=Streptomyces goshikiensis TaxID=1942 RepID=UPI003678CAA1